MVWGSAWPDIISSTVSRTGPRGVQAAVEGVTGQG
jgi:hypothetical protein